MSAGDIPIDGHELGPYRFSLTAWHWTEFDEHRHASEFDRAFVARRGAQA